MRKQRQKTAKIIHLPHEDFSFNAIDFKGNKIVDKYRANEIYVGTCQYILELNPKGLKAKVAAYPPEEVGELIRVFKRSAEDYEGLTEMFKAAAARLRVVQAKLV